MTGVARIGISGWTYAPWRGEFYPAGLRQKDELSFVAERMTSIEINGTFYSLQRPESFVRWREATPDGFRFAVKGGRFITHMKRLVDVEVPLANFFASGPLALGPRLGPFLWQLPPTLSFDADVLERFLTRLPRTSGEAARIAAGHDERVDGRAWLDVVHEQPLRHAVEVRHESFLAPRFVDLMREHDVAVVVADTAGKYPVLREATSSLVYVRLHGDTELYASGYSPEALDGWARSVRRWADEGRDVHVYFDNDMKVRAPFDALALQDRLADLVPAVDG